MFDLGSKIGFQNPTFNSSCPRRIASNILPNSLTLKVLVAYGLFAMHHAPKNVGCLLDNIGTQTSSFIIPKQLFNQTAF